MPIYKNTKNGPLTVDTAEGDSLSVRGKGKFKVSRNTELSARFRRLRTNGSVLFVGDDPEEKARKMALAVAPVHVQQPQFVEEVAVPPETAPILEPASDAPGQVPTADESLASVAPVDAQLPEESPDDSGFSDFTEESGAAEPEPGEGATDDDTKSGRKRKKRWGRSSKSED